jgi:translation initiation factor 1A
VTRMLGNGRCEAICVDSTRRLCHIRGKMHKKVWIAAGDIVLVGLRDYQDDVILRYMNDEARLLKAYGELPETLRLNEGVDVDGPEGEPEDSDYIQFEDEDIDKIYLSFPPLLLPLRPQLYDLIITYHALFQVVWGEVGCYGFVLLPA